MFVFTMNTYKKTFLIAIIAIIVLIAGIFIAKTCYQHTDSPQNTYSFDAADNSERIAFIEQFGWNVKPDPIEMTKVLIPTHFNDTYNNYNNIQLSQGLDLNPHKGKTCQRFTYEVTNYPDIPNGIYADIIVLDNKVIAGDICSVQLDGFMKALIC